LRALSAGLSAVPDERDSPAGCKEAYLENSSSR